MKKRTGGTTQKHADVNATNTEYEIVLNGFIMKWFFSTNVELPPWYDQLRPFLQTYI